MKKKFILNSLIDIIPNDYIIIIIGKNLYERNKRKGILFLDDTSFNLSFALGIVLSTTKNVFIICEDEYAIRNMSEFMQMAVSKCKNLFVCLLISGVYSSTNSPTIFKSINSQYSLFHGLGFFMLDFTKHFSKNNIEAIKLGITKNNGPVAITIDVEADNKRNKIDYSIFTKSMRDFLDFLKVEEKINGV